ncbi:MAG: SDR family NAD(P)-dependent oxidoreductase [Verrucomicrobia bacterium]|nr:SDR family NAD(P)-dependent oxidoreductase [Verrucomicrobiota bacterium]
MKSKLSCPPVALITGASQGLGAFLARELVLDGFQILIHYRRNQTKAVRLVTQIRSEGRIVDAIQADLAKSNEVERMIVKIKKKYGRLDLLINNAGTYRPTPLLRTSSADWQSGLDGTATATFHMIQASLPLFPQTGGRIINLGDSACERLSARKIAPGYHLGKIGVLLLTRSFAPELIRRMITVNCISPGYLENSIQMPKPSSLPGGRPVSFSEVLAAVRYLISPEASQVTGTNLILSGGWNL